MTYTRIDLSKYVVISVWFGCNNNCSICMLAGLKQSLPAIGFENFKRVLYDAINKHSFENLILSGAEVTTFDDLERYLRFASSLEWFKKIQIQTNGRKLNDRQYLRHLIDSGVNEFFISIHGLEDVHDAITRCPGAFDQTMQGIDNLELYDVNVISNTVLTKTNIDDIPALVASLAQKKISEIHLWNFFPMEKTDSRDLVVSLQAFNDLLPEILKILRRAGKALVLKSFPECLPIAAPGYFDNFFPVTVIPDVFWREFSECGFGICCYRERCKSKSCWGLSSAYVHKYGDERELLSPFM